MVDFIAVERLIDFPSRNNFSKILIKLEFSWLISKLSVHFSEHFIGAFPTRLLFPKTAVPFLPASKGTFSG